jgi:hypothetical protein
VRDGNGEPRHQAAGDLLAQQKARRKTEQSGRESSLMMDKDLRTNTVRLFPPFVTSVTF